MNHSDWYYFCVFSGIFGFLFFLVEIIYIKYKLPTELTRKFLHFLIGVICACFCHLFQGYMAVLLLTVIFYFILGLGKHFHFMNCIHNIKRKSFGGVIFPISVWLIFFLNKFFDHPYIYFQVSILIMSISDPLATLGGLFIPENEKKGWDFKSYIMSNRKTKLGSLLFLISSFLIVLLNLTFFAGYSWYNIFILIIVIPVVTTVIEAFSKKGWDNILIPFGSWMVFIVAEKMV